MEETEEIMVLAELTGIIDNDFLFQDHHVAKVLGIDTDEPILQIDNYIFSGEYQDIKGTAVVFEEKELDGDEVELNYLCKTFKKLAMKRVFIQEKGAKSSATSGEKSGDTAMDDTSDDDLHVSDGVKDKDASTLPGSSTVKEEGGNSRDVTNDKHLSGSHSAGFKEQSSSGETLTEGEKNVSRCDTIDGRSLPESPTREQNSMSVGDVIKQDISDVQMTDTENVKDSSSISESLTVDVKNLSIGDSIDNERTAVEHVHDIKSMSDISFHPVLSENKEKQVNDRSHSEVSAVHPAFEKCCQDAIDASENKDLKKPVCGDNLTVPERRSLEDSTSLQCESSCSATGSGEENGVTSEVAQMTEFDENLSKLSLKNLSFNENETCNKVNVEHPSMPSCSDIERRTVSAAQNIHSETAGDKIPCKK